MRVLQINSVYGIGSTGRIAMDINDLLIKKKYESYVFYGRETLLFETNIFKIGNKFDIYWHVFLTRIFDKHGFGSKKSTKKLINKIEEIQPDIIHIHNIHGYYLNIEELFGYFKKKSIPVVWTLHDCWSFTGHCSHFEYINCEKYLTNCYMCPQKKEYPKSLFIDNSTQNFTNKKKIFTGVDNLTIVTPSDWLSNITEKTFLNEYPILTINNGINLEIFKPTTSEFKKKNNLTNKFIILGVASTWTEKKGLNYFIELSKKLSHDEIIILVGLSKKQIKKMPDNILGIEKTNNINELAQLYSLSDVFVNPTLEDTYPTTNLESLSCGTPVITFNTGGSPESIDDKTGIIVERGNLEELYSSIMIIKKNGKEKYSEWCLKKAEKSFSKELKYLEYINLYENILKKKGRG